jgi:citrate synthase
MTSRRALFFTLQSISVCEEMGSPLTRRGAAVQHHRAQLRLSNLISLCENERARGGVHLKIGSQAQRSSAISASNAETIVVRGHDLCGELVGAITFTDHIWLLIAGQLPNAAQRRVLDATLVAIAEHGLVPSVAASRMTLAAAPEALQGAVAAGILGCGSVILGSADAAARLFDTILARAATEGLEPAARAVLGELRAARKPVPGYGHPLHKRQDPRVARLLGVATEAGVGGRHIEVAELVERMVPEIWGKALAMNVSGAIAAVLLDAGYPLLAVKGVPMLARTASLIAHLTEEQQRPIGFLLADSGAGAIDYDGRKPDGFEPDPS